MKKIFIYPLFALLVSAQLSAGALQPKSTDYVIVPDEQQASIETVSQSKELLQTQQEAKTSLSAYDSVIALGDYFKVKKDGKYGIVDRNGNVILAPVFQKVNTFMFDGRECFIAKANGKYRVYYNTGVAVPEENLYTVSQNTSVMAEKELSPQFHAVVEKKEVVYTKVEKVPETKNLVYEIKEIPIVKVKDGKVDTSTGYLNAVLKDKKDLFTINKKQFYIVKENNRIGISDIDGELIIPVKYDYFSVKTPCKHFRYPVFVVSSDNVYSVYDIKGKLLAEQVYDKINIYQRGGLYTFTVEDGQNILRKNGKIQGYFVKADDGYKYHSQRFTLFTPHKVNSLIMTILNN